MKFMNLLKKWTISFSGVALATLPALARAAEGHEAHELNIVKEIVFPYINFFILVTLLIFLIRRPLKDFLLARSKNIAQEIEQAAHEKNEAEAKALNYERRLQNIEAEMTQLVESFKKEGELAKQRIIEEAQATSQRMLETARLISNQEILKAKERLKEEAIQLSAEWAERLIRENLNPKDRERMIQENIQGLEGSA
jgi:F-type H+-transporting ATPase subunit b